jgi:hypothetical protein
MCDMAITMPLSQAGYYDTPSHHMTYQRGSRNKKRSRSGTTGFFRNRRLVSNGMPLVAIRVIRPVRAAFLCI